MIFLNARVLVHFMIVSSLDKRILGSEKSFFLRTFSMELKHQVLNKQAANGLARQVGLLLMK